MQPKWILTAVATATVLVGCATPMDELVLRANETGDWSAVERRMAAQARREAQQKARENPCPSGQIPVIVRGGMPECTDAQAMARALERSQYPFY
ncbi:MAG: hypothetical protein AAFN07_09475 [Pseudomonadota bacterium]